MLDNVRLDLVVLPFAVAFREALEALLLGPGPRQERDAARIREPLDAEDAGGDLRDALRLAAVGRDEVHLRFLVGLLGADRGALRDEGDPAPIRRPARLGVLLARAREAPRLAAESGEEPQARAPHVL